VEAIMTPAAFTVEDDTPVDEVARCMLRERVHRLIVTRSGRLAGIVSTMDMLRGLLPAHAPAGHHGRHPSHATAAS
jgi:CBS domain-containing protein